MIKSFTLGLIMGAVIGVLFGVLFMAVLVAGKDDNPSTTDENAPKFEGKQFRQVILPFEGKTVYRRFIAILERARK